MRTTRDTRDSRERRFDERVPRLPIHLRKELPAEYRRAADLWIHGQAMVERLGVWSGKIIATLYEGRVVRLWMDVPCDLAKWPGRDVATRIQRLLAGSRLRYGTLTLEIVAGRLKWITPAPRSRRTNAELTELARLFDVGA